MNKKKKHTERIKSALIVLLLISAVVLGGVSGLFRGLYDDGALSGWISGFFDRGGNDKPEESVKSEAAAKPLSIVVTNEAGGHYGVKYDVDKVDSVYIRTRDTFREAIGSADLPAVTDRAVWQSALQEPGVYYEYLDPVRLSILCEWYGTSLNEEWGDTLVRRLCVTINENGNKLYYQNDEDGNIYAASTAARGSAAELTESFAENNAVFVFEVPGLETSKNLYMMLLPDVQTHPVLEAKNPLLDEQLQKAFAALGVSEHIIDSYPGPGGETVYVGKDLEKDFTIRQTAEGKLVYTLKDKVTEYPAMNEVEAVEAAREIVSVTIGSNSGDAKVYLDSIVPLDDGGYTVTFQYVIAGGQVYLFDKGYAAQVTIRDGVINEVVLNFRNYKITEEPLRMLPEIQAAAASDGEFVLNYSDQGADKLEPEWVEISA
jgi:hypothetical protein